MNQIKRGYVSDISNLQCLKTVTETGIYEGKVFSGWNRLASYTVPWSHTRGDAVDITSRFEVYIAHKAEGGQNSVWPDEFLKKSPKMWPNTFFAKTCA
jgi:hypothetical protein